MMQELTSIGGNMLNKLSQNQDNQNSEATSRRESIAQSKKSKTSTKSKSNPKKPQHLILFLLFWLAMGWTAFSNLIDYLPSQITVQAAEGAFIGTAAARILIFLTNSWLYCHNLKQMVQMHVLVDKLFIAFITASYSYINLSTVFYQQSDLEITRQIFNVLCFFMQVGCLRILCKNVGWRNWEILALKLLMTGGSAVFIYLSKIIKQYSGVDIPNFTQMSTVYVVNQSLYFGLLYNEISTKSSYGEQYANKFGKMLQKIMGYFVADPQDQGGEEGGIAAEEMGIEESV